MLVEVEWSLESRVEVEEVSGSRESRVDAGMSSGGRVVVECYRSAST